MTPDPASQPAGDPRRTLGSTGEDHAAAHLERLGLQILARRYRTRFGELDLVAAGDGTIVFVEVKTRRRGEDPWLSLHDAKRLQVRRMAAAWLADPGNERPYAADLRFDAVAVVVDGGGRLVSLDHVEDAF